MGRNRIYSENDTERTCRLCLRALPVTAFNPNRTNARGYLVIETRCNECRRAIRNGVKVAELQPRNDRIALVGSNDPAIVNRLFKYRLTLERFNQMVLEQDGLCKICLGELGEDFSIDHCHDTSKVRGLLCHPCNIGLGHFRDNPEYLARASEYLKS